MRGKLVIMLFLIVFLLPVAASAWPVAVPASSAKKMPDNYRPQVPAVVDEPENSAGNDSTGVSGGGNAVPFNPPSGYKPFKAAQPGSGGSGGSSPAGQAVSSAEPTSSQKAPQQEPLKAVTQNAAAQPETRDVPQQVAAETPRQIGTAGSGSAAVPAGDVKAKSQPDKENEKKSPVKPHALVRIARFFKKLFG